jgi:hypothetical protein
MGNRIDRADEHETLATSGLCRVTRCEHGTVHVTLGCLTLRLSRGQLEDLASALGAASARLQTPARWTAMC